MAPHHHPQQQGLPAVFVHPFLHPTSEDGQGCAYSNILPHCNSDCKSCSDRLPENQTVGCCLLHATDALRTSAASRPPADCCGVEHPCLSSAASADCWVVKSACPASVVLGKEVFDPASCVFGKPTEKKTNQTIGSPAKYIFPLTFFPSTFFPSTFFPRLEIVQLCLSSLVLQQNTTELLPAPRYAPYSTLHTEFESTFLL